MHSRQMLQLLSPLLRQVHAHLPPVAMAGALRLTKCALFQAGRASPPRCDGGSRDARPRRPTVGSVIVGEGIDGQQHLVLLRFQILRSARPLR